MTVNNLNFGATVSAWARQSEARLLAIFKESTERTVSNAQLRIPVDLGFARASVRASTSSMPQIDPNFTNKEKVAVAYNPGEISLVIVGANLGQVIYIGWTANYVGYLENGHSQKAPSGFVRLAAMRWPQTVKEVTAEARSRSNARSR